MLQKLLYVGPPNLNRADSATLRMQIRRAMIEENARNQQPIRKSHRSSELFQEANRAVSMHFEQPQIRFKTNIEFELFLSLSIKT
jgi:hypothetical protein